MTEMKATASARPNIALIKYWGKRNNELILPFTNSLSVTLDTFETVTTVDFSSAYTEDAVILNNTLLPNDEKKNRVISHINLAWETLQHKPRDVFVKVVSKNNFPTGSGLASSSSGFAALTYAVVLALDEEISLRELSILARRGSGSACRSIYGGFVEWHAGKELGGYDSYATKVYDERYWNEFKIIVAIIDEKEKMISSRLAMEASVKTSPLFSSWIARCKRDIIDLKKALEIKAFSMLGKIAEENSLAMHAVMEASQPPVMYRTNETHFIISAVQQLRGKGVPCYITSDAGCNVQIITLEKNVPQVLDELTTVPFIKKVHVCSLGSGVEQLKEDLF